MANTNTLIQSTTVGAGGASSVTFSSIPNTYNDLLIKCSLRTGSAQVWGYFTFNGTSTSNYSLMQLIGLGSGTPVSGKDTSSTGYQYSLWADSPNQTANTFSSTDIYIPNYAGSNHKSCSIESVTENSATSVYTAIQGILWANTSAITSITFTPWNSAGGETWAQNSSFYLYGIKNS